MATYMNYLLCNIINYNRLTSFGMNKTRCLICRIYAILRRIASARLDHFIYMTFRPSSLVHLPLPLGG